MWKKRGGGGEGFGVKPKRAKEGINGVELNGTDMANREGARDRHGWRHSPRTTRETTRRANSHHPLEAVAYRALLYGSRCCCTPCGMQPVGRFPRAKWTRENDGRRETVEKNKIKHEIIDAEGKRSSKFRGSDGGSDAYEFRGYLATQRGMSQLRCKNKDNNKIGFKKFEEGYMK